MDEVTLFRVNFSNIYFSLFQIASYRLDGGSSGIFRVESWDALLGGKNCWHIFGKDACEQRFSAITRSSVPFNCVQIWCKFVFLFNLLDQYYSTSKYHQERTPPLIDDFLFICDGAYKRVQLLKMEMNVFKAIDFDLAFPLSYRFLRRYARVRWWNFKAVLILIKIYSLSAVKFQWWHLL